MRWRHQGYQWVGQNPGTRRLRCSCGSEENKWPACVVPSSLHGKPLRPIAIHLTKTPVPVEAWQEEDGHGLKFHQVRLK